MRYTIQEALGRGGSGTVFRAFDTQLNREVALKRIHTDIDIENSIRKEAGILATLNHPNIVTVYDFATDEEGPFVVMERVEGRDLDDIVAEGSFSLSNFLEFVEQVCRGLSAAHARGLVHRDIKPKNIMLQFHDDNTFTTKILDFGLAKVEMELEEISADGTVAGTPHTISPEQLLQQPATVRSDIYSLGCVFYFVLSGHYPHDAEEVQEIVQSHLNGTPVSLHRINSDVPEPLAIAISRMISRDPAKRPQSAQDVRTALWAAARAPSARGPGRSTQSIRLATSQLPGTSPVQRYTLPLPVSACVAGTHTYGEAVSGTISAARPATKGKGLLVAVSVAFALLVLAGLGWFVCQNGIGHDLPTVDPLNAAVVEEKDGEVVNVKGIVTSVEESALFHSHYLRFSGAGPEALVLSVSFEKASGDQLRAFIGKDVRALGRIEKTANVPRLVVESGNDIKTL